MSKNKLVACMLGTVMLLGQAMPVWASEGALPVLTLDVAIKKATERNREISTQQRKQEYLKDKEEMYLNMGSYGGYLANSADRQYAQKKESLEKEQIKWEMSKLFDEIIILEKEWALAQKNIEIKEKEIKKQELMYEKGLSNELNLDSIKLTYQQLKDSQKKIEDSLEKKYSELCTEIGTSTQRYALEKEDNVYVPYSYEGSADSLAQKRAEEHIDVWRANKSIDVVEASFMGGSYEEYLEYKNRYEDTKVSSQNIEEQMESYIRDLYVQLRQIEQQHELLLKEIELKEKELKVNQVYLESSLISEIDFEKSLIALEEAKVRLQKLVDNHTYLKKQLNNPSLISLGR